MYVFRWSVCICEDMCVCVCVCVFACVCIYGCWLSVQECAVALTLMLQRDVERYECYLFMWSVMCMCEAICMRACACIGAGSVCRDALWP